MGNEDVLVSDQVVLVNYVVGLLLMELLLVDSGQGSGTIPPLESGFYSNGIVGFQG